MSHHLSASQKIDALLNFLSTLPSSSSSDEYEQKQASGDKQRFYITTAINYTNGRPHIGHAYEAVTSDVIARYHRIYGRDVFFLTGTDEHGQKVANTAIAQGFEPKAFCDQNVQVFKELNQKLAISNDYYVRTTDADHYTLAKKMFQTAYDNGDIYKSKYKGWYDERNEKFLTETQAKETNYVDPVSNKPYAKQEEDAYFFKMSKYQQPLLQYLEANPDFIAPDNMYQLIYRRLTSESLEDLCVSRSTFSWGVPVPIDDAHVIYVWFDALSNYLTGIKYFDRDDATRELYKFWPADVHIIGKDIVWFHTVIWPCILMSCQIALPRKVFCHGFVSDKNGEKMSKSIGNVVDPFDTLSKYNADSIRYFICTQTTYGSDMRWNAKDLEKRHDAHLAHIYGNLVFRALNLCQKECNAKIPAITAYNEIFDVPQLLQDTEAAFTAYDLSGAADVIMNALRKCNDWITVKAPWKIKGKDAAQIAEKQKIIRSVLECIYILAHFMQPYTPTASRQVFHDLNHAPITLQQLQYNGFANLEEGRPIQMGKVLFVQHSRKVDRQAVQQAKPIIARVCFKVGEIVAVNKHEKDERLYVESINVGEAKPRQVVSGLAHYYTNAKELLHKKCIVFANLKYSKFKGVESQGMVMCATNKQDGNDLVRILEPAADAQIGETLIWQNNLEFEPDESINIGKKNNFYKNEVAPKLQTDKDGNMSFDGQLFTTKNGACVKSPISNVLIT
eukprot:CAMPEP_0202704094 /NCGR_PEP_ID=MMETSP1385-20130828/16846_1 /ASSEMBLY_ACC=CAM_ASM_000861 /TAXON_ID=933848 /ORGANISM="Elphidium margaritaceum" /LENGTH=730 /DNA_ID=CAMNT_0049362045 /DNA_START=264 /DNA_END=2456 /DNA_ORIENTATION=+